MAKHKAAKQRRRQHSSLKEHRQQGKVLKPPLLAELPLTPSQWSKNALPEFLWIDAVHESHGWPMAVEVFHRTLDTLDALMPEDAEKILDGTISSFALLPAEMREPALDELYRAGLYDVAMPEQLRHALALYGECPAGWLLARWRHTAHADPVVGLGYLRAAVQRLFPNRDVYSTRCRMIPMARTIKHGKMLFASHLEIADLLPKYPAHLDEAGQRHVESFTRATFMSMYHTSGPGPWVPYFWRHNFDISPCEFLPDVALPSGREGAVTETREKLLNSIDRLRSSLDAAILRLKLDVYEPDRDEVLLGLLTRQFRLFGALARDPNLWTAELGNVFRRMLTDGLILIAWLAKRNDAALFRRYKDYSIGKQKLLKLHFETLADERGADVEEVIATLQESLDEEMWEEFVAIDVGAPFEKMDARKMAQEVGLSDWYTLGFSPLSADVHGEWTNLKSFYLQRCANPLHHYHRVPQLKPAIVLSPMIVSSAAALLIETVHALANDYSPHLATAEVATFIGDIEAAFSDPVSETPVGGAGPSV